MIGQGNKSLRMCKAQQLVANMRAIALCLTEDYCLFELFSSESVLVKITTNEALEKYLHMDCSLNATI